MKKLTALLLFALLLLLPFTACGKKDELKTTSTLLYYGDTESKKPLRILMDISNSAFSDSIDRMNTEKSINELLSAIRTDIGDQDIVVEFIPNSLDDTSITVARATAVSRLRVEIMSGSGPDVFIMHYKRTAGPNGFELDTGDVLFKYPQKVMESGLFLPLDDYMENNTKHTEWEKFPQAVMDAGRNEEGQQIIPISFTFPLLIYPKEMFDYTPTASLCWSDLQTDPTLAPFAADLINNRMYAKVWSGDTLETSGWYPSYEGYVLGEIADHATGELLFTEEELLQYVKTVLAMNGEDKYATGEYDAIVKEGMIELQMRYTSQPYTLLPLYSDDGGVTACIEYYAAVNRNTDKPEEAFAVIDNLLSTNAQQNFGIYSEYLCPKYSSGVTMNEELYNVSTNEKLYGSDENYAEMCALREQITHAYFSDEAAAILSSIVSHCAVFPDQTEEYIHKLYVDLQRRVKE